MTKVDELRRAFFAACADDPSWVEGINSPSERLLEQLIEAAKAEERERCAKAVIDDGPYGDCQTGCMEMVAEMIRGLK